LLALITVYTLWGQVGGQSHLDLVPWSVKLALGVAASFGIARAAHAAASNEQGWNGATVKWAAIAVVALFLCGMASVYAHNNLEDSGDESDEGDAAISSAHYGGPPAGAAGVMVSIHRV
jgi:hypothetical protein